MRQDMATNGLATIGTGKEGVGAGVGLDLVCLGYISIQLSVHP